MKLRWDHREARLPPLTIFQKQKIYVMQKAAAAGVPATLQITHEELENIINRALKAAGTQAKKYLTKREAQEVLQCSARKVNGKIADGTFRISKGGTAQSAPVRILAADVFKDLDRHLIRRRLKTTTAEATTQDRE
jgi:ribosomal protein L16/L10AE